MTARKSETEHINRDDFHFEHVLWLLERKRITKMEMPRLLEDACHVLAQQTLSDLYALRLQ